MEGPNGTQGLLVTKWQFDDYGDIPRLITNGGEGVEMKASLNDLVRLLVDMPNDRGDRVIPKGSEGGVVECFNRPREGYAVDFSIPDDRLVGGFDYENIMVTPDQFEVVEHAKPRPQSSSS